MRPSKHQLRPFALLMQRERVSLIDAEHGLVIEAAPLAAPAGKGWAFDQAAAALPGCQQMYASAAFPLAEFFGWFLERVYPVRKLGLTLVSNLQQPLSLSLWQHLFADIGLREPLQLRSPLQCLGSNLIEGLLVYLEDGLAQIGVFEQRRAQEQSQVGYGFYLSRAIRQHVLAKYGLRIDSETAAEAWQRLGGERQVTLLGRDGEGRQRRQLLIAEELEDAFAAAFAPLLSEIGFQRNFHPALPLYLLGPQAASPWLAKLLAAHLPGPLVLPPDPEGILIQGIQRELKSQI
ncbi:MAG: hypothetical protein ACAI44_25210 [Candidatus Sericytochromatia bacterium]